MTTTTASGNPHDPYHLSMLVTPEQALAWLEGNTHNRPINQAHVNRLARDIKAGRWRVTHQGVAFDIDGLLIDGQHRLWAVVEADMPVTMWVFFNEPAENRQVLDSGLRRSNLDILNITGKLGEVTRRHLATLRAMLAGCSSHPGRLSPGEEAELYRRHQEAVEFAVGHLGIVNVRGVATSQTYAVIARAWYSADHDRLIHFCDVMKSGMATGQGDSALLMLRDFLISAHGAGKGDSARRLRYAKTQWALSAFLQGKLPRRLYGSPAELFPLPEEIVKAAVA